MPFDELIGREGGGGDPHDHGRIDAAVDAISQAVPQIAQQLGACVNCTTAGYIIATIKDAKILLLEETASEEQRDFFATFLELVIKAASIEKTEIN